MNNTGDGCRVLVLGATGLLGSAVLRYFADRGRYAVTGSVRSHSSPESLPRHLHAQICTDVDVEVPDSLARVFAYARPEVVVNCVGIVKQLPQAQEPLIALSVNALLPHRLLRICSIGGARLVHVSTDCVFSGTKGMYREEDHPDATDLYGVSKRLGEVQGPNAVTLRTSIIGPERAGAHGLVSWFLSQHGSVQGYSRAIFSGLPSVELARVIHDFVIPRSSLQGLYHVSAEPIDKCALLQLISRTYGKDIDIIPDDRVVIDRSLDSTRFRTVTGYVPPHWPDLVAEMRKLG